MPTTENVRVLGGSEPDLALTAKASPESKAPLTIVPPPIESRRSEQIQRVREAKPSVSPAPLVSSDHPEKRAKPLSLPGNISAESVSRPSPIPLPDFALTTPAPIQTPSPEVPNAPLSATFPIPKVKAVLQAAQNTGASNASPHAQPPTAAGLKPRDSAGLPLPAPKPDLGYVPPRPLRWVKPDSSRLGSFRPIDVQLKVRIDEGGHVTAIHLLTGSGPKPAKALVQAAVAAAAQWVFEPATIHGKKAPSEDTLVFRFTGKAP